MDYRFSVLISVYYKEIPRYLDRALQSITDDQILKPNEIVLIKDGPLTKELDEVIGKFKKKYPNLFKIVTLEKNYGLGKALNIGLENCTCELVARMDGDDISKPDRFEKQIKVFQKYPEIDICSACIEEFENTTENILSIRKLPEYHEDILKYAKHRCPINHPVVMYRKSAVLKAGGYQGFPEDYRLWINMLMTGAKFYNIQQSLLYFRFSHDMVKRRGGWKYAIADAKSQWDFYKIGFIGFPTFIYNISVRITVRLTPNCIRTFIYKKLLRK